MFFTVKRILRQPEAITSAPFPSLLLGLLSLRKRNVGVAETRKKSVKTATTKQPMTAKSQRRTKRNPKATNQKP